MSVILQGFARLLYQVILLISVLILLRGHNNPGGGFIGALIGASAVALYLLSFNKVPKPFNHYNVLIFIGVILLALSAMFGIILGKNMLTGIWWTGYLFNEKIKFGTPLLFDVGIYISILGSISLVISKLEQY